ncbi:ice-binding family protein [Imperialibacter roseus]|uniref:Ice-binding family protein n=1 Tax=Imperialibacter roseus TaxID=1324217 RepID=A0ABZ0IJN2_9BACT|nr:ice-binding family protein [Imperialibacter roseus]WOK04195.1 ice-binding family protein [Imperialibacter roseus]
MKTASKPMQSAKLLFAGGFSPPAAAAMAQAISGEMGGLTLMPGTYTADSFIIQAGNLTLDARGDAEAVWIFEASHRITTLGSHGGNVVLRGEAQAKNIFWKTDGTISIGSGTSFSGKLQPLTPMTIMSKANHKSSMPASYKLAIDIIKNFYHKMKTITNYKKVLQPSHALYSLTILSLIFSALILTGIQAPLQAQDASPTEYTRPSWHFGVAAGGNFNFYRGTTQQLNDDLTVPTAFRHGKGLGLYVAPSIEFYKPDTRFGVILQGGYDSRKGSWDQVLTSCNCPADLSTNLGYISIEPSLRFAPFKSDFYLYAGPRFAFNRTSAFTYELGINPAFPEQAATPPVKGDFSNIEKTVISMQVGAGYDIQLSSVNHKTQFVLSPFASFQPQFGQDPRSTETWHNTTVRLGAALKFGKGKEIIKDVPPVPEEMAAIGLPEVQFTVVSPANIPIERRVRETFPLRNYVFFDLGSTEIPDRYVTINKTQVKDFKEDQLEVFTPKHLTGRSDRGMVVYYNILNILGDRMGKNPQATINLVGSSRKSPEDGREMATTIKTYLVDVFGINAARISVDGRSKSKIPSQQPGGTEELVLLQQEDRRVSIESSSPALLMEFQSGPEAALKPVEFVAVQVAPIDSYVSFRVDGADEAFESWSLDIKDEQGKVQSFGPFTRELVNLPGKSILGTTPKGKYEVTMIGQTPDGKTVKKEATVNMVLWTPEVDEMGMRYSVIYEFNNSTAIAMYEKYLTEIVAPKIPHGGTVIIHGHTDVVGDAANNEKLSLARANDVKTILTKALSKAGRTDVTFKVLGFGEEERMMPFGNKWPEERFYNRTVLIDIIPAK